MPFHFFITTKMTLARAMERITNLRIFFFIICRYLNLEKKSRLRLWSLMPLSTIFQLYGAVSFIDGGNQSTRRKPPTCCKPLTSQVVVNLTTIRSRCPHPHPIWGRYFHIHVQCNNLCIFNWSEGLLDKKKITCVSANPTDPNLLCLS